MSTTSTEGRIDITEEVLAKIWRIRAIQVHSSMNLGPKRTRATL